MNREKIIGTISKASLILTNLFAFLLATITACTSGNIGGTGGIDPTATPTVNPNPTATATANPIANTAPTATSGTFAINEDTPHSGVLSGQDPDTNQQKTFSIVSLPTKGTVSITDNFGGFNYVPNADLNGTDQFTFKLNDGISDSNVATVNITINPVDDTPSSQYKLYYGYINGGTISLAFDAHDVDGDNLTYSKSTDPTAGTLTGIIPSLKYTPNAGFAGYDSFTYQVSDGNHVLTNQKVHLYTILPYLDLNSTAVPFQISQNKVLNSSGVVYSRVGSSWTTEGSLSTSGTVALFQNNAVVGSSVTSNAKFFQYNGSQWLQQTFAPTGYIPGAMTSAAIGTNFTVLGNISNNFAYVIELTNGTWQNSASLHDAGCSALTTCYFGKSVAIQNNRLVVGASGEGAAYIYTYSGSSWSLEQKLTSTNNFGSAVALDGDHLAVAASNASTVRMYKLIGGVWTYQNSVYSDISGATLYFGNSIGLSGSLLAVGANNGQHVRVFYFNDSASQWNLKYDLYADNINDNSFGKYVSLSSGTLVVSGAAKAYVYDISN